MSLLALTLIVLSGGWVLYRLWYRTRYRALKDAGHPQYFSAVAAAAYLMMIASSLRSVALGCWGNEYAALERGLLAVVPLVAGDGESALALQSLAGASAWALVVVYPLSWLLNLPLRHNGTLLRAVMRRADAYDQLEALTSHVLERELTLAVTLDSGKVYIGFPVRSSTFDEERRWIALFPVISGHRDLKGRLELTTGYQSVYAGLLAGLTQAEADRRLQDFQVVIPLAKVQTLQVFDLAAYSAFHVSPPVAVPADAVPLHEQAGDADTAVGAPAHDGKPRTGWQQPSRDEAFRLGMYNAFLVMFSLMVLLLPHVPVQLSLLLALGALVSALVAVEPRF